MAAWASIGEGLKGGQIMRIFWIFQTQSYQDLPLAEVEGSESFGGKGGTLNQDVYCIRTQEVLLSLLFLKARCSDLKIQLWVLYIKTNTYTYKYLYIYFVYIAFIVLNKGELNSQIPSLQAGCSHTNQVREHESKKWVLSVTYNSQAASK